MNQTEFINIVRTHESKMLREVLTKYLGRAPTIIDAKKTVRVFTLSDFDRYSLIYEGVTLGTVKYEWPDYSKGEKTYRMTFVPLIDKLKTK